MLSSQNNVKQSEVVINALFKSEMLVIKGIFPSEERGKERERVGERGRKREIEGEGGRERNKTKARVWQKNENIFNMKDWKGKLKPKELYVEPHFQKQIR